MYKSITITSTFIACLAILLIFFPGLRQYISSTESAGANEIGDINTLHSQNYSTTIVSTDPLLIYISDFLSDSEMNRILGATENLFVPSRVYNPGSPSHRNSSSCVLPDSEPIHELVIARSKSFLDKVVLEHPGTGLSYFDIEPLQLVSYGPSEYYHAHVDWFDVLHREKKGWNPRLYNRGASFFVYLEDGCNGGETHFPQIATSASETQLVTLGASVNTDESGISFRPRKGNGLFWVNLKPNGLGDDRLIHAGMPVKQGRKVGMNIWVKRDFGR